MVLSLELSAELERKLIDRARAAGQDAKEYVQQVLERDLKRASLDEVLEPLRAEVERSGMSDDELDTLVERARESRYRERQGKNA